MSYINELQEKAYEMAYGYFKEQDYLDSECEFYGVKFADYVIECMEDEEGLSDAFDYFLSDVVWSEKAEKEKEAMRYVF